MMEQKIRNLRTEIDYTMRLATPLESSKLWDLPEGTWHLRQEALKSLRLARMWLGCILETLETEDPYPNSDDPSNEIIENPSDVSMDTPEFSVIEGEKLTHITQVKHLRLRVEQDHILTLVRDIAPMVYNPNHDNDMKICLQSIYRHLREAKMWLGVELGAIRDLKKEEVPIS